MSSWIIRYSAESTGLKLQEVKLRNNHPKVEDITISTDDACKLMVAEITLKDVCTEEEAIKIGDKIINFLFDQIAIEYDVPIGSAERFSCKNKAEQTGNHSEGELEILPLSLFSDGSSIYTPSEDQLNILKDKLEKEYCERNIHIQLYRSCIAQKDAVSKFMFLYNLLLLITGDTNQEEAEKVITRYEPHVEKTKHTREHKGKTIETTETVYTRLRNEIAHKREGCSPEKTRNEIDSYVNRFQHIVKKAVLEEECPEKH